MLKSSLAAVEGAGRRARMALGKGVLAVSLLTCSTLASALGLGEITLHSALNQPLNAEIQLLETGGLSNEDVIARLASPEAFAKAGIERVFFLNDLRFTPVLRGDRGVIRVVSSKPVTEPYLSFLVQLARPNGDLLHEYTVLLDPATSAQGLAATRSRNQQRSATSASESRMPIAPPAAVQGKHYTVASGDTLNGIASRLQGPGNKVSASQLADGIRSLNPQVFAAGAGSALKVGQDLLLPDAAVLPSAAAPAASAAAPSPKPAELQRTAEQLSAAAIENQQLAQSLEALKAQTQELQEQMSGKDKQIIALRSDLAAAQSAATPSAPATATPAPATPAAAPATPAQPVAASGDDSFLSLPILLAAVLIVLLLVAFAYSKRRQQRKDSAAPAVTPDDPLIKPAQAAMLPVFEVPAVAPQPVVQTPSPAPAKPSPAQRSPGSAPDALDGVSIYIAYGRFTEAMGILRSALETQPERDDIRIRLLELLAEQGDGSGFVREEQAALEHGVDPQTIQDIRDRFPQLKAAEVAPVAAVVPAVTVAASTLSFDKSEPEPALYLQPEPEPKPAAQLDESAAAALNPQHTDEFQLNLDDLSMDADWDLVDPFDSPPPRAKPAAAPAPAEVDPGFSSDLTQLPEVFELSDEQFLSDFSEPEIVEPVEVIAPSAADGLSDDFLDSFMNDDADFDLLDLEEPPLSQINQAQVLIEDGDLESAREILQQVIDESDEEHQRMARGLLASIT
ncbi:LysM peptidoglycan-binding domain-containing protein [Pseudomonas syringae]|uniref:LysM peptidoglycan-binding domain-containing protein n=1 Tax=Pseudomonas syringae TaxID=317 RepID=A0A6B2B025_PSESX|nr:FimV/HubP family polar landmark protein [Pseudomonas syringae]MBI6558159.1 LysM peptidoglycan-binding domain-containing protein [Pseudomonas syringae]MBI6569132.1 LysM peptidoglycan-binding domain-containing protein [Pseudomonas syringae]MBI6585133.1 LysM peptidoglycan-binding domain-containing protein [Pseudomonas syringae]MBI6595689.1 LysM peptidoglycan-binding domain-containing protein [Pseudomonas syringae]MDC6491728.1 LysM peptidoglycan-binding domain-containing protein [Pseudomonas sy